VRTEDAGYRLLDTGYSSGIMPFFIQDQVSSIQGLWTIHWEEAMALPNGRPNMFFTNTIA